MHLRGTVHRSFLQCASGRGGLCPLCRPYRSPGGHSLSARIRYPELPWGGGRAKTIYSRLYQALCSVERLQCSGKPVLVRHTSSVGSRRGKVDNVHPNVAEEEVILPANAVVSVIEPPSASSLPVPSGRPPKSTKKKPFVKSISLKFAYGRAASAPVSKPLLTVNTV